MNRFVHLLGLNWVIWLRSDVFIRLSDVRIPLWIWVVLSKRIILRLIVQLASLELPCRADSIKDETHPVVPIDRPGLLHSWVDVLRVRGSDKSWIISFDIGLRGGRGR